MLELKTQSQPVYGEIYHIPSKVFKLQKQIIKLQKKLSPTERMVKYYQRNRKRIRKKHRKIHNNHRKFHAPFLFKNYKRKSSNLHRKTQYTEYDEKPQTSTKYSNSMLELTL